MKFQPVQADAVGDWGSPDEAERAAEFLTDLQDRLAAMIATDLDDELTSHQEMLVNEMVGREFFTDVCGVPAMLDWDDDAVSSYVAGKFSELVE